MHAFALIKKYPSLCLAAFKEIMATPLYPLMAVIVGVYVLMVSGIMIASGNDHRLSFFSYNWTVATAGVSLAILYVALRPYVIMIFERPDKLGRAILQDYADVFLNPRRWMGAFIITLIMLCFFAAFTSFKSFIPEVRPFFLDPFFAELDRKIHFGVDPWRLLAPLLAAPIVTFAIGFVYKFWFLMKFYTMFWQGYSLKNPPLRAQFFLSLIFCWIINGSLFALIFSSAGPCYFGLAYPDLENPYHELMSLLHKIDEVMPVWSFASQAALWSNYVENNLTMLSGISAFPSMHVSIATIFLLLGVRYGKICGIAMGAFFVLTLAGSVWLGWHYAVDGYFSILTSFVIWKACGWLVLRYNLAAPHFKQENDNEQQK